ncbi:MAG: FAD-dependent oxidoreductase [Candidatus Rokubacteria bacterium]|nr:FAD-dependent oxidoreductase [Candidatus Rokubacteria bacterium]
MARDGGIVVVGAGPAGLAAAAEVTRAGVPVTIVDESRAPGGQFFRDRGPGRDTPGSGAARAHAMKARLLAEIDGRDVTWLTGATVWSAIRPDLLALFREGRVELLRWQRLVVATGAYERSVAFPGWTLPGVMTPGAVQILVKAHGVTPGPEVLLAGSGPFLWSVAEELLLAGVRVSGLVEAGRPARWASVLLTVARHPARLAEAWRYLRVARRHRVPVRLGWAVVAAHGTDRLEAVTVSRVDAEWRPVPGTEQTLPATALAVGFGFLPSTELTRHLGCAHRFDELRGGWVPGHDDRMETDLPGVYVAGEVAGIGGAHAAMAEGRLAGLAAALALGSTVASPARLAELQRARRRAREFGDLMLRIFRFQPGLGVLAQDDTTICRCEEVTAGQLRARLGQTEPDLRSLRGVVRAGMGLCQGRTCGRLVAGLVSATLGVPEADLGMLTVRPPFRPIPVAAIAGIPADVLEEAARVADRSADDAALAGF